MSVGSYQQTRFMQDCVSRRNPMRKFGIMALIAAAALFTAPAAFADHKGKVPWLTPEQGMAQAKKSGKPMMLFFSASW
jgi:hypothetical protein